MTLFLSPSLALLGAPVDIGRDQAQQEAARELLKPGYQQEGFFDRIYRIVSQFLGDLVSIGGGGAGSVVSLVVIVVILAILVALLFWAMRRMSRGRRTAAAVFGGQERTAEQHRAEAERLASEGDWTGAVQERLRAIARGLEERAIVSPLPGRTALELAESAGRSLPAHASDLRTAARVFDDVTYGEVAGTPEAYAVLKDLDEKLAAARVVLEVSA
ncbi:DUF4129 domain-containing protein [Planotetraspora kaengkrachanensis]|uniref:Protein-glutamine gamma-glutamyltransferase-like C-terminal domain-containing protein n=1 Tax=Planotetraspora kaengkrachanensis TaxID=575193 RepID=A0A8J3PV85_9ACTN|nr:DUF4129 domain-containing protein [Planotetraspora kaengkrachanensis]GIG81684.1 hypothetical protein Pka01_48110 [Planotetraspora kaengkrachanensis]